MNEFLLRMGQIIYINNEKYSVINMIKFNEANWIWYEYEIISETNIHKWLSVEENENKQIEFWLYDVYYGNIDVNEIQFISNNNEYELYESGIASVVGYYGNADVDMDEKCKYFDYISKDKKSIISVEKWEDETEKSIGNILDRSNIIFTEEIYMPYINNISKDKSNMLSWFKSVSVIFVVFLIGSLGSLVDLNVFSKKTIDKYLKQETQKYIYVTSVTNNANNKKARVYESSLSSIDVTVKDIIDGVPNSITTVKESDSDDDGIGLCTKNEYAYVYEEDENIYVQVSNKKYLDNSGSTYHSKHYNGYYRTYNSFSSSRYSNYVYSARQQSINSRVSSGGGTSSGK